MCRGDAVSLGASRRRSVQRAVVGLVAGWVLGLSASAPPPQGMGELTRGPRERGAAALHTDPSRVGSISHVAFLLGFGTGARCGGVSLSRVPISSFCARLSRFRLARRSLCARVHVVGGAGSKPPLSDPASPPPLAVHMSTRPGTLQFRRGGGLRAGFCYSGDRVEVPPWNFHPAQRVVKQCPRAPKH